MAHPNPKPKYILKGPRPEEVVSKKYTRDEDGLHYDEVTEVIPCWTLFMPHGPKGEMNSIRITSRRQLQELGLDGDVPLIDPETGETVGSFAQRVAQDYGPDPVLTPKSKSKEAA